MNMRSTASHGAGVARRAALAARAGSMVIGLFLGGLLLSGCATAPVEPAPRHLFDDALFAAPSEPVRADAIFALDAAMKQYVDVEIAKQLRAKGPQRGLLEALYSKNQLRLDYDAVRTRNAAEAFEARSGNCLSLVIMTAAFAKHLGVPVRYQSVYTDTTWTRSGSLYFSSTHVNLALEHRATDARPGVDTARAWTVDFLPPEDLRGQRVRTITEATVMAMYMNNRAAEALAQGKLDDAYAWGREAVVQSPAFLSAYNTLAVIYLRHGNAAHAERLLRHVLDREPDNTLAMSNLARVLGDLGRPDEAARLTERLARIEPQPPFYFFDQGMAALQAGNYRAARDLFRKELKRAAYQHEFHFWLAIANLGLGDRAEARKHLIIAKENSTTFDDRALYAAKLEKIEALRVR
jgi:tetratricopeptide (TPR) repeat protein